jgi:hypothetical protein
MKPELVRLFDEDQREREFHPQYGTQDYWNLRHRDSERRERVLQIIEEIGLQSPEDRYHAAMILHHGETLDEIWKAHELAKCAAERGLLAARWLAAAAYDRWLMYQGKAQKYGTQIVPDGTKQRVWDVDPQTSDEKRAEWGVPTLEEQNQRAEKLSITEPMPPMDEAPDWLKEAIKRWRLS